MLAFCVKGTTVLLRPTCFVSRFKHSPYRKHCTPGSGVVWPFSKVTALRAQGKSQTLAQRGEGPCSGAWCCCYITGRSCRWQRHG